MADASNILPNGVIFSMLRHTDPNTVRGRSTQKDGVCIEHIFRNGSFCELEIAKESNDLSDLAKVLPESYQKSNEFSVNRKCRQNVGTDDRRTFSDKDKVHRIQTLGNDNKDAMLDCESGSYQSEDKRKLNCHNLKVLANENTSVLRTVLLMVFLGLGKLGNICCGHKMFLNKIGNFFCVPDTKFVSATNVAHAGKWGNICVGNNVSATMFLLKLSTLSAAMFLFVSLVLSLLCV